MAKVNKMADEISGGVSEKFEVQLEYQQLIQGLSSITSAYNRTIGDMTKLGTGIGQSFNAFANDLNNSIVRMSGQFASSFSRAFGDLKREAGNLSVDIKGILGKAQRDLETMGTENVSAIKNAIVARRNNKAEIVRQFDEEKALAVKKAGEYRKAQEEEAVKTFQETNRRIASQRDKVVGAWKPETVEKHTAQALAKYEASLAAINRESVTVGKNLSAKFSDAELRKRLDVEDAAFRGKVEKIRSDQKQIRNEFLSTMSDASVKASNFVTKTVETSGSVIAATAQEMRTNLSSLSTVTDSLEAQVQQAVSGKQVIASVKKGAKEIGTELANMNKDVLLNQKAMDQAAIAQHQITIDKYSDETAELSTVQKEYAQKVYQDTVKNAEAIHQVRADSQKKAIALNRDIAEAERGQPQRIKDAGEGVKAAFSDALGKAQKDMQALDRGFGYMLGNFKKLGTAPIEGIKLLNSGFADTDNILGETVKELSGYESLMKQLGTAGYENAEDIAKGFNRDIEKVKQFKKEMHDAVMEMNTMVIKSPLATMQPKYLMNKESLAQQVEQYRQALGGFAGEKLQNITSFKTGVDYYEEMVKSANNAQKDINRINNQISRLEIEAQQADINALNESNEYKRRLYESYAKNVRSVIEKMRGDISKSESQMNITERSKTLLSKGATDIKAGIEKSIPKWNQLDQIMKIINKNYETMQYAASRHGKANFEAASKARDAILNADKAYRQFQKDIIAATDSLEYLQRKGFVKAEPTLQQLRTLKSAYADMQTDIRQKLAGTGQTFKSLASDIEKSFFRRLWEGFRQIRWQTAALAYMFGMVARTIEQHFIGSIDEIDNFRKSVYALTGTIGGAYGDSFKDNFDRIFSYSHELMNRLQAEAATTYASLEDLTMVVRTLAQHGIFVKTDEDVKRVGTLASAIKVLTEGMANEGVQMRQEMMALIEGRTRVTDSVARMLKNQGIDIVKEMEKWAREGTPILEGMTQMLAPFAVVNEKIVGEWGTAVKNLKEIWGYVKRIAGEEMILQWAKQINELVVAIGKPGGELTEVGKSLAVFVKSLMQSVWDIGEGLLNIFVAIVEAVGQVVGNLFGISREMPKLNTGMDSFKDGLYVAAQAVTLLGKSFKILGAFIRELVENNGIDELGYELGYRLWMGFEKFIVYAIGYTIGRIVSMIAIAATKAPEIMTRALMGPIAGDAMGLMMDKLREQMFKAVQGTDEAFEAPREGSERLRKSIDEYINSLGNLEEAYNKVGEASKRNFGNFDIIMFGVEMNQQVQTFIKRQDELNKKYREQVERIDEAKQENQKYFETLQENLSKAIVWYEKYIEGIRKVRQEYIDKYGKEEGRKLANKADLLDDSAQKELEKTKKALEAAKKEYGETQWHIQLRIDEKTFASLDQYYGIMERFGRLSPFAKIDADAKKAAMDIEKWTLEAYKNIAKDGFSAEEIMQKRREMYAALAEKTARDKALKEIEMIDKVKDFHRKAMQIELTETQKIAENYQNMSRDVDKAAAAGELGPTKELNELIRQQLQMELQVGEAIAKSKRIREEVVNITKKQLDVMSQAGDMLQKSTWASNQALGKEISLRAEYAKSILDETENLRKFGEQWGDNKELMQAYTEATAEGVKLRQAALEYELERVQKPFWAELEQLSKGWADTISSELTDFLMGAKTFAEAMKNIFQSITKEILNLALKKGLIEPMMEKFGGSFGFKTGDKELREQYQSYLSKMMTMQDQTQNNFKSMLDGGWMARGTDGNPMVVRMAVGSGLFNGGSTQEGAGTLGSEIDLFGWGNPKQYGEFKGITSTPIGTQRDMFGWGVPDLYKEFTGFSTSANAKFAGSIDKMPYQPWFGDLQKYADQNNISVYRAMALVGSESQGNPNALSPKGAYGLTQLMPGTARDLGVNPYASIEDQLKGGMAYYGQQYNKFGNYDLAAAAYNAGPGNVSKYGGIPPFAETQTYVTRMDELEAYARMKYPNLGGNAAQDLYKTSGGQSNILDVGSKDLFKTEDGQSNLFNIGSTDLFKGQGGSNGMFGGNLWDQKSTTDNSSLWSATGVGSGSSLGTVNMTASVVNVNGAVGSGGGIGGIGGTGSGGGSGGGMLGGITDKLQSFVGSIFGMIKNIMSGLFDMIKNLFSGLGNLFGGSGGGGGLLSIFGMAEGGKITEPILGRGLRSGKTFAFGEKGNEYVFPESKLNNMRGRSEENNIHFTVHLNAIDTQSGTDFMMKQMPLMQAQISKAIRNNQRIRDTLKGAR